MPSDVRYAEILRLFKARGWVLNRIRGSHHVFKGPGGGSFSVPVHNGKVKHVYYKQIQKFFGEAP